MNSIQLEDVDEIVNVHAKEYAKNVTISIPRKWAKRKLKLVVLNSLADEDD